MTEHVLVFDVNETLIDLESLTPHFERTFSDPHVLREWFGQLVMHSMALTLSGNYTDFFTLGQGVLRMLADIHGVTISDDDVQALAEGMRTMPAYPDVEEGLQRLRGNGYRLVTLTNSPHHQGATPLENAGLAGYFERQFTVGEHRVFKPSTSLYTHVASALGVEPGQCTMVASHTWDLLGAQSAGYRGVLITRPGNAPLTAPGVPQPQIVAADLLQLNDVLTRQRL
ncbi:haloacid dehalogenase type II [Mycolicibacterium smegmatis]|uniref:L-2-haloacid dehalogenase n=4 Tax=Mycolicibacterium smegmatis TaxID=1772 RepID=I7G2H8_MYCS2|nr:haloacid dehalogenase type II [Mycolicibacterium smegmatis]ABK71408.1 haloacid dehalogenase, type II [Mycolicibacterium smegmatis MC2 155]AFP36594.1 L-2-haloacid dehalogenase [Mycolicibacterium smegmatis MC2 155]AIU05397.1 haloacid dehalogenase [Mycolicibacterium smegmatis MC2 155]AIU12022.1 haloacid dehalogenase [Mycolicibacterium smegmatis]AIU18646.1 haloacid dehalogenase [Mycolicibacterium smegmatis]